MKRRYTEISKVDLMSPAWQGTPSEIFVFPHTHMSSGGRYKKGGNRAGCKHWHGQDGDRDKNSDNGRKNKI